MNRTDRVESMHIYRVIVCKLVMSVYVIIAKIMIARVCIVICAIEMDNRNDSRIFSTIKSF